jgi:hypothetical protein
VASKAKNKCKVCGAEYLPRTFAQTVCSPKCLYEQIRIKKTNDKNKLKKMAGKDEPNYKKLAWRQISKYVRYTISTKDKDGKVKCYTCPKTMRPEEADCGHFKHDKLDGDLRNLKIQCSKCNRYLSGNLSEYRKNLVRDNGEDWVQQLEKDAIECKPLKQWQHKEIYDKYKLLNKE